MSHEGSGRTARSALRIAAGVVAAISAVLAVVLVVFADSSTAYRLGTILGLWTVVIGSFAVIRVHDADAEKAMTLSARNEAIAQEAIEQLAAAREQTAQVALDARREAADLEAMSERVAVEVRRSVDLERQAAAAQQREFLMQLELMLRRQLESTMERELSAIRDEVSALRSEMLDQLGGQLRLERIETTRLIGSDVEALQREVSQLASMRKALQVTLDHDDMAAMASPPAEPIQGATQAPVRAPVQAPQIDEPIDVQIVEDDEADRWVAENGEATPISTGADRAAAPTAEPAPPRPEPDTEAPSSRQSPPEPAASGHPADNEPAINKRLAPLFADLPSLSHFRDTPSTARAGGDGGAARADVVADADQAGASAAGGAYSGRRRRSSAGEGFAAEAEPAEESGADDRPAASDAPPAQRDRAHGADAPAESSESSPVETSPAESSPAESSAARSSGGRRRRSDDQASDILSRLLGR